MQQVELQLQEAELLQDFCNWLQILGYQDSTIYAHKCRVKAILLYVEKGGLSLKADGLQSYVNYISKRPKKKKGKGHLSLNGLMGIYSSIDLLQEYHLLVKQEYLGVWLAPLKGEVREKHPLSGNQIQLIYEAIEEEPNKLLRLRDRAIMALLYGCGLRRGEVQKLELSHLLFRQRLVYVLGGKTGRQRYVPMTEQVKEDIKNYIYEGRYIALPKYQKYLMISRLGKPLSKAMYQTRLKKWEARSGILLGLHPHLFRHSIATHLLQAGMSMEQVSNFLGHQSLSATQIYTHIKHSR